MQEGRTSLLVVTKLFQWSLIYSESRRSQFFCTFEKRKIKQSYRGPKEANPKVEYFQMLSRTKHRGEIFDDLTSNGK